MLLPHSKEDLKKLLIKSPAKKDICACLDELLRQKTITITITLRDYKRRNVNFCF